MRHDILYSYSFFRSIIQTHIPEAMQLLFVLCLLLVASAQGMRVAVTGAGGRTGQLLVKKLLQNAAFSTLALVRTEKSAKKLYKKLDPTRKDATIASRLNLKVCNVEDPDALEQNLQGVDKLVLCTSAVPKINFFSIIKVLIMKLFRRQGRPTFTFPNGSPYNVDWIGAKNQIDAAKKAGVKQMVFLSSMGGTEPDNFLNSIGKVEGDDKSGNILLWKRKAEEYLVNSGMSYTIVHPGGLLDKEGGVREIVYGVDDELLKEKVRSIPRDDVAEVCLQCLIQDGALNRSFDIISKEPSEDTKPTKDWKAWFSMNKGTCKY